MHQMAIDRRTFVAAAGALAAAPVTSALSHSAAAPLYAAARRTADGRFSAALFSPDGRDFHSVALPGRGHDVTVCPRTRRCVVFARRPGNFAVVFSADRARAPLQFDAPLDRHFYGHGVFSPDGRLLYATENDFDAGQGVIGVYDASLQFRRLGEFRTYGIGPHDLALLDNGKVLVVANGGLREHPDFGNGRRILNLASIQTSLVYLDAGSGDLLEQHVLSKVGALSLRHLDVGRAGTVLLGAQVVAGAARRGEGGAALVYRHRRQEPLTATGFDDEVLSALSGYVSSVEVDARGEVAAVTSSKSGSVALIEIETGRVLRVQRLVDVSGVARTDEPGDFVVTSGTGILAGVSITPHWTDRSVATSWNWDNHAVRVPL